MVFVGSPGELKRTYCTPPKATELPWMSGQQDVVANKGVIEVFLMLFLWQGLYCNCSGL
jgi:hypothetical protein